MTSRSVYALLFCAVTLSVVVASPIGAAPNYDITIPGSVDTPERTVTFKGTEYTVSAIGSVAPGESLAVSVHGPADQSYDVYLYNDDRERVDVATATGDDTVQLTAGREPGSYVVVIYFDGTFETIHPVVVTGYDVALDAPTEATRGEEVHVAVTVSPTASSGAPERVDVVLAGSNTDLRVTAEKTSDGYEATLSLEAVPTGSYSLYAVVRGADSAYGHKEVLGITEQHTLEVTTKSTSTTSDSGGTTPTTTSTTPTTATTTTTTTHTPSTTTTATTTRSTTTPSTSTSPSTDSGTPTTQTPTTESPTTTPTTPGDSIITPTTSTGATTTDGQPGFGVALAGLSLVASLLLYGRWDQHE